MAAGPCPPPGVLEAIAAGVPADAAVGVHLAECGACRAAVAEAREVNAILAEVRRMLPERNTADLEPANPAAAGWKSDRGSDSGYEIHEEIHHGGQGVVYRAIQKRTRRTVAIKMLPAWSIAGPRQRERFEREARIAAALRHPNIVTVHDSGHLGEGRYGLVMEYIEGVALDRWSRSLDTAKGETARGRDARRRALRERLGVMVKVCDAVFCAHQNSIVHRDLKPANILVDAAGEPHVLDFGIARDLGPEQVTRLTHTGEFAGTLAYASPEQVSGDLSRVDTRTDIYSLGVILYEIVSGRMPYPVDGPVSRTIRSIESQEPAPLARQSRDSDGPWVDGEVATIVLKAMAKEPARRYQTAAALRDDLARYIAGEAIEARRDSTWYVLRKTAARHRLAVIAGLTVFALVAVSAITAKMQASRLAVALSRGNVERGRARVELENIAEAQALLWPELLDPPAGVERWDPGDERLTLSLAWWALWELHAAHPCAATVRVSREPGLVSVGVLRPVPGRDDLLLIADTSGMMGYWSLPDLRPQARATVPVEPVLSGDLTGVWGAAFAPGGEIVTVATDNTVRRWDAATLEPRDASIVLPSSTAGSPVVVLSADGGRLAVRDPAVIRLIDPRTGSVTETIKHTSDRLGTPVLSADGRWLAYTESNGLTLRRIGAPDSAVLVPTERPVRSMVFAPGDGAVRPRLFFSFGSEIFVVDATGNGGARRFAGVERVPTLGLWLSGDGRWLAACGEDRRIWVWQTGAPETPARLSMVAHDAHISALAFARDGGTLFSGHVDGVVQSWDLSALPPEGLEEPVGSPSVRGAFTAWGAQAGHTDSVFAVAISGATGAERAYSASYDGTVRAWDLENGKETARWNSSDAGVESIALSPDGATVAAAIDRGDWADVAFLDASTLHEHARIERAHGRRSADLAFSPDGATLATGGDDGFVRLWDVATLSAKAEHRIPVTRREADARTVRFSPDGRSLAWGGHAGAASLSDTSLAPPTLSLVGNRDTVRCIRFTPDGRRIAGAGNDSAIWVWDASTGRALHTLRGHVGVIHALDYSADGRFLASGGDDGSVRLWDARTGDNLAILRDATAAYPRGPAVYALRFTHDGSRLLIGGASGYLGLWDLRHYDRHIAGNAGYWIDRLKEEGRPSPIAKQARRWAEGYQDAVEKK